MGDLNIFEPHHTASMTGWSSTYSVLLRLLSEVFIQSTSTLQKPVDYLRPLVSFLAA